MNTSKKHKTSPTDKVIWLCQAGIIAALYIALTYLAMAFGLDKNAIQVRFSEALCILAFFTSSAIPGLTVGCLLANLLTGCAPLDIALGPIATLAGALGAYLIGKAYEKHGKRWLRFLITIPTILANTIVVPYVCYVCYTAPGEQSLAIIPFYAVTVCIGEIISAGIIGMIFFLAVEKKARRFIKL